jgi:signal transduction histidine kinase
MVAHDLKGPVSIIFGYTELMMMEGNEVEVSREDMVRYAGILLETGHKMANIINELLMLAKVRRQDDLPLEQLDTNSILNEVLFRLDWQIKEAQARITMPQSWPVAVGYAPWVEEVWVNYIQNAIKYAGEKPEIVVGFDESDSQADGHVRFWVKDSGPVIAAEEQKHLFLEFSRVGERKIHGHGLGLAIVRRIIERMGGRFGVESEVGEGSLFFFTLPAVVERAD